MNQIQVYLVPMYTLLTKTLQHVNLSSVGRQLLHPWSFSLLHMLLFPQWPLILPGCQNSFQPSGFWPNWKSRTQNCFHTAGDNSNLPRFEQSCSSQHHLGSCSSGNLSSSNSDQLNQKLLGWAQQSGCQQALQVKVMQLKLESHCFHGIYGPSGSWDIPPLIGSYSIDD